MGIFSILALLAVLIAGAAFPIAAPYLGFDASFMQTYSNYSNLIIPVLAFIACLFAASKYDRGDETKTAWIFIGLGSLSFAIGQLVFVSYFWFNPTILAPPYPGIHDIFYMLCPILMIVGLYNLRKSLKATVSTPGALISIFVAIAAIVFAFIVQWPALNAQDSTTLSIIVSIMYTFFDPIMLGFSVLAISIMLGGLVSRPWWLIVFGLITIYAGDIIYNYLNMSGIYSVGMLVDITWPVGFGLIFVAALWNQEILR